MSTSRCGVLQCVAVCCSVLQCVAVCLRALDRYLRMIFECLPRVAVCCSVLQCVAVCRCVLQCVAVRCSVLQCVAVCCSVLQCIAGCCSVLQCVAVHRSLLQHDAASPFSSTSRCAFSRLPVMASISSIKMSEGAHALASAKISRISFSDSPDMPDTISGALT